MGRWLLGVALLGALVIAPVCSAATGVFGSYIRLSLDGSPDWYGLTETGGATTVDFHNLNLGTYLPPTDSLSLLGGQVNTFKNSGGDVTGADLFYRVYESSSTPGAFQQVGLGFGANSTYVDAGGVTITGGGDQKWETTSSSINLLAGLTPGSYLLEVFARASTNEGERFHNNGGPNYTASFAVAAIPEPGAFVFGALAAGAVGLTYRARRARKA